MYGPPIGGPLLTSPVLPASPFNPYGQPMPLLFDEQNDDEVKRFQYSTYTF